jgi:hypothetical protein
MNRRACSGHGPIAAGLVRPLCASWSDINQPAITAPDGIVISALCYDDFDHRVNDASRIRMLDGQHPDDKCQTLGVRQPVGQRSVGARMDGANITVFAAFTPVCDGNRSPDSSCVKASATASEPGWRAPLASRKPPSLVMSVRSWPCPRGILAASGIKVPTGHQR